MSGGHGPDHAADHAAEAAAGHGGKSIVRTLWNGATYLPKKAWGITKKAAGFGAEVGGHVWDGTVGAVSAGAERIGQGLGFDSKEKGVFRKSAALIRGVTKRIGRAVEGVVDAPGAIIEKPLRAVPDIIDSFSKRIKSFLGMSGNGGHHEAHGGGHDDHTPHGAAGAH